MSLPDNRRHPAPPAAPRTIAVPARVRYALQAYRLLAWFFATCVVIQIFLAGMAIFIDPARWAWHRNFVHSFEVLPPIMLVLAFLARLPVQTRWLTAAPFVLLAAQYATASIGGIAGAFHPVNGLLLFWLLVTLARRAGSITTTPSPAAAATSAPPSLHEI